MELTEQTWHKVQGMIESEKVKLIGEGINDTFAGWQAVYAVASQMDPPMPMPEMELQLCRFIRKEREKREMAEKSPYQVEVVEVEDMPNREFSKMKGRWEWLRDLLFSMQPDAKPYRILMPNKREAKLGSSASQNIAWTPGKRKRIHRTGRLLPREVTVRTSTEPVIKTETDGKYYLYVRVITRPIKSRA